MFVFGSGVLFGKRTDISNATPLNFGLVQEVSTDLSFDTKMLYGQYAFPVAIARGKAKFTAKAKMARVSGLVMANLFLGVTPTVGQALTAFAEPHSVASSGALTITVTQAATFVEDWGVVYAATGLPLTVVSSGPTLGTYSVNPVTGVYTFSAADAGAALLFNYTYSTTTAGTQQLTIINPLMGTTPTFEAQLYTTFNGLPMNIKLFQCVSSKLSLGTKLDDFMIPEIDFDILANAAGNVGTMSFGDVS